jgi:hypothetical protein
MVEKIDGGKKQREPWIPFTPANGPSRATSDLSRERKRKVSQVPRKGGISQDTSEIRVKARYSCSK